MIEVGWRKPTWVMVSWLLVVACGGGGEGEGDAALVDGDNQVVDGGDADAIEPLVPADGPMVLARGFYMGVIPRPPTASPATRVSICISGRGCFSTTRPRSTHSSPAC